MPRMTFTQSLSGVVVLMALVGTGCDQWLKALEEAQAPSNGGINPGKDAGGPSMGTGGAPANAGSAGAPGAAVSCKSVVNENGATCKSCVDANGASVYEACDPVPGGSGGTTRGRSGERPGGVPHAQRRGPDELRGRRDLDEVRGGELRAEEPDAHGSRARDDVRRGRLRIGHLRLLRDRAAQRRGSNGAGSHHVRHDDGCQRRRL